MKHSDHQCLLKSHYSKPKESLLKRMLKGKAVGFSYFAIITVVRGFMSTIVLKSVGDGAKVELLPEQK